jgi:hypothetical protein
VIKAGSIINDYNHSQVTLNVPYLDYEFRQDRPKANQWTHVSDTLKVDQQLVDILQKLWSDGFMTIGSCRGHPPEDNSSSGYINFTSLPVPNGMFPLGPQQSMQKILTLCHFVNQKIKGVSTQQIRQNIILSWPWDKYGDVIVAVEEYLYGLPTQDQGDRRCQKK